VRIGKTWGDVCARGFDNRAAAAVCRTLGFASGERLKGNDPWTPVFGKGQGPMLIHQTSCKGAPSERFITGCTLNRTEAGICKYSWGVAVLCGELA